MDVAIRADASPEIGTGHLMRCLTLADALARKEAKLAFLCAAAAEPWRGLVEARGHRFVALPLREGGRSAETTPPHARWAPWGQAADAAAALEALPARVDWLIVDHYALDARWERAMRPKAARILVIDDLADRDHDCDVLLDHNPQDESGSRYEKCLPTHARGLIGPRYALLRPEFAAARAKLTLRDGRVRRFAVFMGGTDPVGATLMALSALSSPDLAAIPVDVAIGGASPHRSAIEAAASVRGNATVHVDTPDIAGMFAKADLAVGAGGVAALERCCVRLPSVTIAIADNQRPGLEWLAAFGAVRHLGDFDSLTVQTVASAIRDLCASPADIRKMSECAGALVDGGGTARVVSALMGTKTTIAVRAATMDDAELLYRWRNADEVRAVSFSGDRILYDDHCRWLESALGNPLQLVLIGAVGDTPVGSVRYALSDRGADISIMVDAEMQGRGIGGALLDAGETYLRAVHPDPLLLRAVIKPDNQASLSLFAKAGFRRSVEEPGRVLYVKELV